MKLAKIFLGALSSAVFAETEEVALLQSRKALVTTLPPLPGDHCTAAGDPHIKPFDMENKGLDCLGAMGDYVLMQNSEYFVHARFKGHERNHGYAFIRGVVVGGSALGGGVLYIPPHNNKPGITWNGEPLKSQFGTNVFQLDGGVELTVRKAAGPYLPEFKFPASLTDAKAKLTYFVEVKKAGVLDLLIVLNQGTNQHVLISGTQSALTGTTGLCGNDNGDPSDDSFKVDDCGHNLPCDTPGKFPATDGECGVPREPPECDSDADKVAFFRAICEHHHGEKGTWQVFTCITDCCGDRDSCPDLNNNGEWGDCLIQGDPHIKTFDSPGINKNSYGPLDDYILMKNDWVEVQGRYGSSRSDLKAELKGVAITGPLVGGDVIYFPPGVEQQPVIKNTDGSETIWGADQTTLKKVAYTINYEPKGKNLKFLFDSKPKGVEKPNRLYTVEFTDADGGNLGRVRVNKPHHVKQTAMTCHIQLKPYYLTGVLGQCGNFNGNPDDDDSNLEDAVQWVDGTPNPNLFPNQNPQLGAPAYTRPCFEKQMKDARTCCEGLHGGKDAVDHSFIESCAVDNCCGPDKPCDPLTKCLDED